MGIIRARERARQAYSTETKISSEPREFMWHGHGSVYLIPLALALYPNKPWISLGSENADPLECV